MTLHLCRHGMTAVLFVCALAPSTAAAGKGAFGFFRTASQMQANAHLVADAVRHVVSAPDGLVAITLADGATHPLFNTGGTALSARMNRATIAKRPMAGQAVALEPAIRLGGWTGWHRGMWEPQLHDAALTTGVGLELKVLETGKLRGTTYQLIVAGPQDAVTRMSEWYLRKLDAQHDASE